ncbi:MAG: hypothetical protein K8R74_02965 [Bacteroidales bacterium]|nr:hypothetical protein [Bacteroidales bacterium]
MKRISFLFSLAFISACMLAQVPLTFNYQAVVRDNTGDLVADQLIGVQISILEHGLYDIPVYVEDHSVTTNQFGLFSIMVGQGESVSGYFEDIDWGLKTYFLQTALDISGGSNYEVMGATQMVSVPYALYSRGLILTDENGNEYEVTVDPSGSLVTNQIEEFVCGNDLTDSRDGQVYSTVEIGNQCWMAENLNVGTMIYPSPCQTDNDTIEEYCAGDFTDFCNTYGGLYLWDEMMEYKTDSVNVGICPEGWRIPTDFEWKVLEGMADSQFGIGDPEWDLFGWRGTDAGDNLKEAGTTHWMSPNDATNSTGFTALPGGWYDHLTYYGALQAAAVFWTAYETDNSHALTRNIYYDHAEIARVENNKASGYSLRCIRNAEFSNDPPEQPSNPSPPDGSTIQSLNTTLSWTCTDPDNDPITYDVYFGTEINPTLISTGQSENFYEPDTLIPETTYYWKIVAHDFIADTEGAIWSFTTDWICGVSVLLDSRDLQNYNTVKIGNQCWMAENLNIGAMIIGSNNQANNSTIEKYCLGNSTANCDTYGGLYQWDEMMEYSTTPGVQGICPTGWHVPTDTEWCTLENEVDAGTVSCSATGWRGIDAGGNLKSTTYWSSPNTGATNSSGFTGLPGGCRHSSGFSSLGNWAYFWTSNENISQGWDRTLTYDSALVGRWPDGKTFGFSVRCLKD